MGGGLMQLVAYGAQDVYLTGNPQITYFKVVYRRHTNFSMEAIEHTLGGNPDFGRKSTVTILRNGDLATRINLKVTVNAVSLGLRDVNSRLQVAWLRRLGHALVNYVEVEIGGSRIDRQYGTWLDIWYELTHQFNQERGYRAMIGDVDALTKLSPVTSTTASAVLPEYTMYIPMQFWFNRNTGLAIPLIALQYHEVRLNFEFNNVNSLVCWSGSVAPDFKAFSMKEASILVDYIYLDSEERRRFAQVGHEYLIEQVQFTGEESIGDNSTTIINYKTKLNFNHPCKELIWALKNGAFNGESTGNFNSTEGRFLTYTNEDAAWNSSALDYAAENLARGMISFNAPTLAGVTSYEILLDPTATKVEFINPDGTLKVNILYGSLATTNLNVWIIANPLVNGTYNLGSFVGEFDVQLSLDASGTTVASYSVDVIKHSLSLTDVSVPIIDWTDFRSTTATTGINPYDVTVVQFNNYGVRLDGTGNPVYQANIQLNGHDRFDIMDGAYFNYVQPYHHHTRTPADGINVYSFALHPEDHQPSGSANLSRIDNTLLIIRFSDPYRANKSVPRLNLSRDSNFYVFAFSYNVLRIMSGMGGLAYSN
jgi:hypothetical protein